MHSEASLVAQPLVTLPSRGSRMSKKPVDSVLDLATAGLAALGLKKRSRQIYWRAGSEGVDGWLGLNVGVRGASTINPVVGLRVASIETLVAEWRNKRVDPGPTYSQAIGYLMPAKGFGAGMVRVTEAASKDSARLVDVVSRYALPFWVEHRTVESVLDLLSQDTSVPAADRFYRLPAGLYLVGNGDAAVRMTETFPEDLRPDDAGVFLASLHRRLGNPYRQ